MKSIEEVMNEWNALLPLSDRDREMLSRRFTIDFNYNSNHIEGNTWFFCNLVEEHTSQRKLLP